MPTPEATENILDELLAHYDTLDKGTIIARRTALKPLYDYFCRLVIVVGVRFCDINERSLGDSQLNTLWLKVRSSLALVEEDIGKWEQLVRRVHETRRRTEHEWDYDPATGNLEFIRKSAPEFREWILETGKEAQRQSEGFTLNEHVDRLLRYNIGRARQLAEEYGTSKGPMAELIQLSGEVATTIAADLGSAQPADSKRRGEIGLKALKDLLTVADLVTKIETLEDYFLRRNVCPACGGNIVQTTNSHGDETGGTMSTRVGCDKCDYELYSETVEF